jgi:Ca-activated chloride channel family protein
MPRTWVIVAAVFVIGLSLLDGQPLVSAAQRAPFRTGVDVIAMNVTVTDAARHYVTDLDRQDFQIFEDGRPQQVMFFRKSSLPLALALLIDTSASMEPNIGVAQEAAVGFVRALGAEDVASVIDFDTRVQVLQDFTTDRSALERAIRKTSAGGSTALYNAVYIALKALNKTIGDERLEDSRRRAIVILSDGEDTSSLLGFDEVLDLAVRSDTAIYAIGLAARDIPAFVKRPNEAQFVLRRLSEQTGGRVFFASEARELSSVYGQIRAELANQYFLAYESNDPRRNGQFRRISVRVSRASTVARARPGYYAPSQ